MTLFQEVETPRELSDAKLMNMVQLYLNELVANRGYNNLDLQLARVRQLNKLLNGGSNNAPRH